MVGHSTCIRRVLSIPVALGLAFALLVAPGARAQPDIDGAVDALISTPFDTFGDVAGSAGMMFGALGGLTGDIVALVDDNEVTRVLLRGVFSTTIRRLSLSTSQTFTGAMEGMRAEDLNGLPEPIAHYMDPKDMSGRVDTFTKGLGALQLAVVDTVGNPTQFLMRLVGATSQADSVAKWQTDSRNNWVGAAR
jgi:hypothetical protein